MNNADEIVIEYPWSMIPIELFGEMIADMEWRIPKSSPLFGKKLVPNLRHQEKPIWIWDNDTDGDYVVFDFRKRRKQEVPWHIFEPSLLEAMRKHE